MDTSAIKHTALAQNVAVGLDAFGAAKNPDDAISAALGEWFRGDEGTQFARRVCLAK